MEKTNLFDEQNALYKQKMDKNHCLIIAHRGSFGGNIIENTSGAVKAAFMEGSDIVELDISRSKDGVYYLFHDGNEKRLLNEDRNIKELTSREIESLHYINPIGDITNQKVERLETFLRKFPTSQLINFDRSWDYWNELLDYFDKYQLEKNIMFKSPVKRDILEKLNSHSIKYMYFPIVKSIEEYRILSEFSNINLIGVELVAEDIESELISPEFIKELVESGLMVLGNAITLNDKTILFGKLGDNRAIYEGEDMGWLPMFERGLNAIQTDWSALLSKLRDKYYFT